MVYKFFDKKSVAIRAKKSAINKGTRINSENQQLGDQLNKPVIRRFEKRCTFLLKTRFGVQT